MQKIDLATAGPIVDTLRVVSFENAFGRFRYRRIPTGVYPVGIMLVRDEEVPYLIATPAKALCDTIARESGFRSMADVGRWLENVRVDPSMPLDENELLDCAGTYGRPSVRWLARYASKQQPTSK